MLPQIRDGFFTFFNSLTVKTLNPILGSIKGVENKGGISIRTPPRE